MCGIGVVVFMALSGCTTKPAPQVQYVRVEVPVQVPCRAPEVAALPWAAADLQKTDSLEVKVRALLAERRQRIGYERLLKAAVDSCRVD
ncbi:lipoprotein [Pseudomonas plecoglossicida]|nr:lipoprotein [Pseudomonas plecoglossicida]